MVGEHFLITHCIIHILSRGIFSAPFVLRKSFYEDPGSCFLCNNGEIRKKSTLVPVQFTEPFKQPQHTDQRAGVDRGRFLPHLQNG